MGDASTFLSKFMSAVLRDRWSAVAFGRARRRKLNGLRRSVRVGGESRKWPEYPLYMPSGPLTMFECCGLFRRPKRRGSRFGRNYGITRRLNEVTLGAGGAKEVQLVYRCCFVIYFTAKEFLFYFGLQRCSGWFASKQGSCFICVKR